MAGIAIERTRFGPNDPDQALARVERSVRAEIDAVASALNDIASSVARAAGAVRYRGRRSGGRAAASRSRRPGAAGTHCRRLRGHGVSPQRCVAARVERRAVGNRRRSDSGPGNIFRRARAARPPAHLHQASARSRHRSSRRRHRRRTPRLVVARHPHGDARGGYPVVADAGSRDRAPARSRDGRARLRRPVAARAAAAPRTRHAGGHSADPRAMARQHLSRRPRDSRTHAHRRHAPAAAVARVVPDS